MATNVPDNILAEREAFYDQIGQKHMQPLWEVLKGIVPKAPRTKAVPTRWKFEEYRQALLEAGRMISAEEAERRVLALENPGLKGQTRITQSLYAGVQMVLPGEHAPSHRHTQTALRFVLQGQGACTRVDDQNIMMSEGDLIITPNWTWHEHVNLADEPMIWLDGLDVPMVTMLDAGFAEEHPSRQGFTPDSNGIPYQRLCHYPFKAMRHQVEAARAMGGADVCHGWRVRYRDPVDGRDPMPTMAAFMQLLPADFNSSSYRSTDGTICVVVEGRGQTLVDDQIIPWGPGDIFVLPAWKSFSHQVEEEAIIFSFSDRPVQEHLGLWREERSA